MILAAELSQEAQISNNTTNIYITKSPWDYLILECNF